MSRGSGTKMGQKSSKRDQSRTTIGLRSTTKERLNNNRAPGQCYDGFLCQLVDLWEKTKEARLD